MAISSNQQDNEKRKFKEDSSEDVAVNVCSNDLLNAISPLVQGIQHDAGTVSYPNTTTEIYQLRQGGTSGTIVATITLVYTNAAKTDLQSWEGVVI